MIHDPVIIRCAAEQKQFGCSLKLFRKSTDYKNRREFSCFTGIPIRNIERMERGGWNPALEVIVKIARSFNLPVAALFDYSGSWKVRNKQKKVMPVEDLATETKKLAERICRLREVSNATLLDVEIECGIPRKTMQEIEDGTMNIDFWILARLAYFFQVEMIELFDYNK